MAEITENEKKILDIVKALSLDEFYPEKITSKDLYEITELSIKETENITPGTICWIFINCLTRNNYKARNLKIVAEARGIKTPGYLQRKKQEHMENVTQFHPLDIIAAVYICCDPIAKQDLVRFMWGCKMSVPLILGCDIHNLPVVNQWPLRALITQWQENEHAMTTEHSIIKYPMQKIGFIRVGDLEESKSALLNGVIGGPEKAHPMFFHRDLYGSQKSRSILVEGLVELGWFFPKGVKNDRFCSCKLFANMRGDASKCSPQFEFLLQTMDLILVLSHSKYFLPQIDIFRSAVVHGKKVVLILTDKNIDQQNDRIETLLKHIEPFDEENFEILPLEDERLATKLDYICDLIKNMEIESYTSLADALLATKHDLKIDEIANKNIVSSVRYASHVISKVEEAVVLNGKKELLPCQGDTWKNWTETELESFSRGKTTSNLNSLEEKKIKLRKQQFSMLENDLHVVGYFIQCISYLKDEELNVFLRTLKLGLDEVSRKMHKPYYEKYKLILEEKKNANEGRNKILNEKLEQLDKEKADVSVGLEHFIRELGQIYEACANQGNSKFNLKLGPDRYMSYTHLSHLASKILLSGFPIEIMDGDVGFVPDQWMAEILRALRLQLAENDARLHVISVLGIQSSGKSTLLNTLFGLQFAVSAGRCTKGVFMQMVKVSESLRPRFKCEFILAIDTEGLRAAHASTKFDNELSCFSIGLADLTIVNLMGENAKYLEENLPVVVHAFLRMDMAGLKPQCILVHQNVDKTNKDKLMEQTRLLEKVLDELTAKACEMEGIKPHKRFKDIIRFNVSDSTYYIPGLLEGDQPMGPISIGYSQGCNALRIGVLQRCEQSSRHLAITEFACHLNTLWNAMKTDQFVFNFRTTVETQTSLQLEGAYSEIYSSLLNTFTSLGEETILKMKRCFFLKEQNIPDIKKNLEHDICEVGNEHRKRLIEYIEDPNKSYSKIMIQWKEEKLQRFDSDFADAKRDFMYQLEKEQYQLANRTTDDVASGDKSELKEIVREELRTRSTTTDNESIIATRIWKKWSSKFKKSQEPDIDIRGEVEEFLLSTFDSEKPKIENALRKSKTSGNTPSAFAITGNHISKPNQILDVLHLSNSKNEVETIANIIETQTRKEIEHIGAGKKTYTPLAMKGILLKMRVVLDNHKGKYTKDFKIDICVYISNYLVDAFSELYQEEREEEAARQKENVIALIKSMMKEQKSDEQSRLCADQVTDIILKEAVSKTLTFLYSRSSCLKSLLTKSKQQCVDHILGTTIRSKAFDIIDLYLTDPEEAIVQMLVRCIETDQLKLDAMFDFDRRLDVFQAEMKKWNISGKTSVDEFIKFTFKTSNLAIPGNTFLKTMQAIDIDVLKFQEYIKERIKRVKKGQFHKEMLITIERHSDAIKRKAAENYLLENLGCLEKCPFCGEICMFATKKHVGQHQAARHRPVGYKDIYEVESKRLSLDICSTLVQTNAVLYRGEKVIAYNDFSKFYPDWKISGYYYNNVSLLWKWYFANDHKKKMNQKYTTIKVVVPSAWNYITEDEVVLSLMSMPITRSQFYKPPRYFP